MTGEELKTLRKEYSLTQDKLADALGTTKFRISEWENGKTMGNITKKAIEYYFETLELKKKLVRLKESSK